MKVIVTGGAGFIGSHLVDELIFQGHEVAVIDNFSTGLKENLNPKAVLYGLDISKDDLSVVDTAGVEVIFHLAARARIQPSIIDPEESHRHNVLGALRIFKLAADIGAKVVHSSSSSVYGVVTDMPEGGVTESHQLAPKSPYALQKLMDEQYLELMGTLYGLKWVAMRYFNVFGERQIKNGAYSTVIGTFLDQKEKGEDMTIVGDGEQRRDFTYVKDVVKANIMCATSDAVNGQIFNIGTGKNYSINDIAAFIGGPTVNIPARPGEAQITLANNTKAKELLTWSPTVTVKEWLEGTPMV